MTAGARSAENLTLKGIDWNAGKPGAGLRLGDDVVVQVTRYRLRDRDHSRVSQKRHPGDSRVYARVLPEGSLTSGDPVRLLTEDEASSLLGVR